MRDPLEFQDRPLFEKLKRRRLAAGFVIAMERAAESFWPVLSFWLACAGLWLLQVPGLAGQAGLYAVWVVFVTGTIFLIARHAVTFKWPRRDDIDRRLEQTAQLEHRPLAMIEDRLANPQTKTAQELWRTSQKQALEKVQSLLFPPPRAVAAARDPRALRILAALIFAVGLAVAGPSWPDRIRVGIMPFDLKFLQTPNDSVMVWITPPSYTGQAQTILQGRGGRHNETLNIPVGSNIKVRVNNGWGTPHLLMGEHDMQLARIDGKSWVLETPLLPGDALTIKQLRLTRAEIPYKMQKDTPPEITVAGAPETMTKGEFEIPVKVKDDYGIKDMTFRLSLSPEAGDAPLGDTAEDIRAVMSQGGTDLELKSVYDFAWHTWAGLPVVIEMEVTDHQGQTGKSPPLHFTLPERTFSHPVAKKLIALRKRLAWTPEAAALNVSDDLEKIMIQPDQYGHDLVTFMALRVASSRLYYDQTIPSVASVISLLWDTALRIEDGTLALAARNLQEAQKKLESTLNDPNAKKQDIDKALNEFQESLTAYLQEMFNEMQKQMADGKMPMIPPEMMAQAISPENLQEFLDKLAAEALSGNKDAAREMLSRLQDVMKQMKSGQMQMPPDMKFMAEGINELQNLIDKQQQLLDQTVQQANPLPPNPGQYDDVLPLDPDVMKFLWGEGAIIPPSANGNLENEQAPKKEVDTTKNKTEQESLRIILGKLMQDADEILGQIPENMGKAELEMRDSSKQLGLNRPDLSVPHQDQTIKYLKEAMDQMSEQLKSRMQQMMAMSFGPGPSLDPLGRPLQDGGNNPLLPQSQVKVPDESQRKRVQEILDTLRKQSGELNRPDYELDYFRRLLRQF